MPLVDFNVSDPRLDSGPMVRDGGLAANMNRIPADFADVRRPFIGPDGMSWVLLNTGQFSKQLGRGGEKVPIKKAHRVRDLLNANHRRIPIWTLNAALLRPEQWAEYDKKVILAARQPLVAYEDMRSSNSYSGFDAYSKMYLEYQAMSDPGEAVVDFDLMTSARHDQPLFLNRATPLPCTHADFFFSDRFMTISGNDSEPIDSLTGEAMAARVSEMVEDTTIGTVTGATYGTQTAGSHVHQGTSTVYGMTNFTYRSTKTDVTTPTGSNPQATVADILAMIQTLHNNAYYGPFTVYFSRDWSQYLNNYYAFTNGTNWAVNPSQTLMQAVKAIDGVADVKVLPRLSGTFNVIVIDWKKAGRAIDGKPPTVLQWDSMGGMRHNFKVWAIQVPQMFAEYNTNCAEVHGTTS